MSMEQEIKLHALRLQPGESLPNITCPACEGGQSREASFSITRLREGLLYHCYRAKCGAKGFIPSRPRDGGDKRSSDAKSRPFTKATKLLSKEQLGFFWDRYGLTKKEITHFKYCEEMDRICQPVRESRGYTIARNLRSYSGDTPKSILYFDTQDTPLLDFTGPVSRKLLIVEDQISAIKCSRHIPTAAMLGTDLSSEKVNYLLSLGVKELVLWYDGDALTKAYKAASAYHLAFEKLRVIAPRIDTPDPKDLTDKEIIEWLN